MAAVQLADIALSGGPADGAALIEIAPDATERRFTYGELAERSNALAAFLNAKGVLPGERVAIAGDNSAEHVIALLGCLKSGAVACLINTKLADEVKDQLIAETDAVMVLGNGPPGCPALAFSDIAALPPASAPKIVLDDEALAMIMFTSGSSGLPKGVPIRHSGYGWALTQFLGLAETMAGETGIVAAPLFHMNGQFHLLNLLSCGARVALMQRFEPKAMLAAIQRHGVKRVTGVPTMAALMAEAVEQGFAGDVSSVEQVGLGSSPLSAELLGRIQRAFPNAIITNGFGTTETGPVSFSAHPDELAIPLTALGYPMAGVELKLVGGASPDEGVLHIRNPMTLSAYWKRPEASAERIDAEGWYITGDRMRRDANGFYFFLGRADDMMQVGAENVYPGEVERLLESHPAVREAAVVAVPHATKSEAPVAFVLIEGEASEAELRDYTLAHGPAYAHPRRIFFLDEMPLASTNKIDRAGLRDRALELIGGSL